MSFWYAKKLKWYGEKSQFALPTIPLKSKITDFLMLKAKNKKRRLLIAEIGVWIIFVLVVSMIIFTLLT